ncbi:hypothetical protein PAPYR_10729 [Paratrimastix pyriformis]|uniref:CHAT domain-containing protein n=1 Tax=Paratrimastix pyriformis TaxID=342808 RepID=A0ABQ8U5C8_9EUKA|nr:hypothetical protein PAPYR_10729 [Paratrimastix pyriformis]
MVQPRVLLLLCSPKGQPHLRLLDELCDIQRITRPFFFLDQQPGATVTDLASSLSVPERPEVIHFGGHHFASQGVIVFEEQDHKSRFVNTDVMVDLIAAIPAQNTPRAIFLNCCSSSTFASKIANIRYVICSLVELADACALAFVKGFYSSLVQQFCAQAPEFDYPASPSHPPSPSPRLIAPVSIPSPSPRTSPPHLLGHVWGWMFAERQTLPIPIDQSHCSSTPTPPPSSSWPWQTLPIPIDQSHCSSTPTPPPSSSWPWHHPHLLGHVWGGCYGVGTQAFRGGINMIKLEAPRRLTKKITQ